MMADERKELSLLLLCVSEAFPSETGMMRDANDSLLLRFLALCLPFSYPFNFRYGESQGSPSETGIVKDSQAALDHLLQRTDINRKKLVIFGRSLGGAVGASLLYRNPGKVQY